MPKHNAPEDPKEWLSRALSNLVLAKAKGQDVYREDLCFNAQQAAEKAIKAVLISRNVKFPYVHDIAQLLTLVEEAGLEVTGILRQAERLTRFAVFTRYPGLAPPVKEKEYEEAVKIAEAVVRWAQRELAKKTPNRR